VAGVVGDVNPKTMESAKRQFVELYGSALVMNTYLKIALVLVSLVALGLLGLNFHTAARYSQVKPLVVRIDDVGRAEAVVYDASRYQPQPPELRYFLTQFVVKHFSRIRSTLQREYPDSLFFLNPALADATIAQNDQSRVLEMFVTNPTADEIEVSVQNGEVTLQGAVPERHMKRDAEDCIESISGVRQVHNQLRVEAAGAAGSERGGELVEGQRGWFASRRGGESGSITGRKVF